MVVKARVVRQKAGASAPLAAHFRYLQREGVELPLRLHGEAVDGIFDLGRRIGVEMAEAAADIRRAAHLPEEPGQAFGARGALGGNKAPNFSAR